MTLPATTGEYALHTVGAVLDGVQSCSRCGLGLLDAFETTTHRFPRGTPVLVLHGLTGRVIGPAPSTGQLPSGTRTCTAPVPSGSKDTRS